MPRILFQLSVFLLGLSAWGNSSHDPDLGWHLFGGAWIASHGQLPTEDFINLFRAFWHDYHWLAQLLLYSIYDFVGLEGLRILDGLVGGLLGIVVFSIAEKAGEGEPQPLRSFVLTAIALTIVRPYLTPRPQIFTFILIAHVLYMLVSRSARSPLIPALCAALLCVNIQVNWVVIPAVWFTAHTLPALVYRDAPIASVIGLLILSAVGLTDPYVFITGKPFINYALLQEYAALPLELRGRIGEMRTFLQSTPTELGLFFALCIPALLSLKMPRSRAQVAALGSAILGIVLACSMLKFLPIFAIVAVPAATRGVMMIEAMFARGKQLLSVRMMHLLASLVVSVSVVLVIVGSPFFFNSNRNLFVFLPQEACERAAQFARDSHHEGAPLRVLTHFNDGGWCRWFAYAGYPDAALEVTTDGRTQDFPSELIAKSFDLYSTSDGWEQTLKEWSPELAIVPKALPLATTLRDQQRWPVLFESPFHYLFRAPLTEK